MSLEAVTELEQKENYRVDVKMANHVIQTASSSFQPNFMLMFI